MPSLNECITLICANDIVTLCPNTVPLDMIFMLKAQQIQCQLSAGYDAKARFRLNKNRRT